MFWSGGRNWPTPASIGVFWSSGRRKTGHRHPLTSPEKTGQLQQPSACSGQAAGRKTGHRHPLTSPEKTLASPEKTQIAERQKTRLQRHPPTGMKSHRHPLRTPEETQSTPEPKPPPAWTPAQQGTGWKRPHPCDPNPALVDEEPPKPPPI
ncbi:hypothetical protein SLA2020_340280 [Shorea laevis]